MLLLKHKKIKSIPAITLLILILATGFVACVDKTPSQKEPLDTEALTRNQQEQHGIKVTAADVQLTHPLKAAWVKEGLNIASLKCLSCHKLSSEKLVGPGWAGVTERRKPEWIINMITNVDMMLDSDPDAQRLLQDCLVRMPNQNLSSDEARKVLEFQRSNDGVK